MARCTSLSVCIALFLLACVHLGSSLKCYQCKSAFNGECDDIKDVKKLEDEDCDYSKLVKAFPQAGSDFACVVHKMVQKDDQGLSVVRGCVPNNYCAAFEDVKECRTCSVNFCNSSSSVVPSIVLSIISLLCAKFYF